jgi:AraC-like DNA-binding protein
MPTVPAAYNLNWLLMPDSDAVTIGKSDADFERIDFSLPPQAGHAWGERLLVGDGITLFHGYHALEPSPSQLIGLFEADVEPPPDPLFSAQIWLSGSGCHREYWHGRSHPPVDIVARPGRDTFRYHREWQATVLIEGGVVSEMKSMIVPGPTLRSLLGEAPVAVLLKQLGISHQRPTVVHSIPMQISMPLREAMSGRFRGPARRLHAQARVLNYLAGLYEYLTTDLKPVRERRHTARIRELRDYLVSLEGQVPTLNELAKDFGLSARHLNAEFAAEFGTSIPNFISDYRLEQAHAAVKEGTLPMKLLAARLGYSHVNHFITAFKRKFGYPPGSLRRGR